MSAEPSARELMEKAWWEAMEEGVPPYDTESGRALQARADAQPRLVAALERYGDHEQSCPRRPVRVITGAHVSFQTQPCDCGWEALAAAAEASAGAVERCAECENWEAASSAAITSGIAGQGSKPPHDHSRPPVRCAGDHQFQPIVCSRCGAHGNINLSIVGEDERLDITKKVPAVEPPVERCAFPGCPQPLYERGGVHVSGVMPHALIASHSPRTACHPFTPPTRCAAHGQDHSDRCPAELGDGK